LGALQYPKRPSGPEDATSSSNMLRHGIAHHATLLRRTARLSTNGEKLFDHQPLHLGSLRAFRGAGLTGLATGFAFGNIGKLLAFRLAGLADLFYALGDGPHMWRIDGGQCLQSTASHDDLIGRVGATGHARILHRIHAEAMPEAIVASRDAMGSGFLKRLVFRRMHGLFARLRKGL
jgi:hypothetical protein